VKNGGQFNCKKNWGSGLLPRLFAPRPFPYAARISVALSTLLETKLYASLGSVLLSQKPKLTNRDLGTCRRSCFGFMTSSIGNIPVLDIRLFYSNPHHFVDQLCQACHCVGFFLLRHDLPPALAERQLDVTRQFFEKPLSEKMKISYETRASFRGYMKLGMENTAGRTDLREQVEYAVEYDTSRFLKEAASWPAYNRLRAQNPWPDDETETSFRRTTTDFASHVCRIAEILREALCLALGMEGNALDCFFAEPHWALKLVSYPHVADESGTDSFGVGSHTDTNFLTMVLQDDVGGLQVFSQGNWIDVTTEFGANVLVCNLGEQAEILSSGYFLATPHRVLSNTQSQKARTSVPLFYNPSLDAAITPMQHGLSERLCWTRGERPEWRDETQQLNKMLTSVGENTFKSLARSHPVTFARHHADLELLDDGRIIQR
jgi:isopenicillin N synthase-like dioxygenase